MTEPIGVPVIFGVTEVYGVFSFILIFAMASILKVATSTTSSTVTVMASESFNPSPSVTVIIRLYILSVPSSNGFSKLGGVLNVITPFDVLILKKAASVPDIEYNSLSPES